MHPSAPRLRSRLTLDRLPLWTILTIPFMTIIIMVVSLTGYLAHENSQVVVNDIAGQLLREMNARIAFHLESFLKIPPQINQINANAIQSQHLDTSDQDAAGHYFWEEVQVYESVSSIYFGNAAGGIISGGREGSDGSLYVIATDNFESGTLKKYATDAAGHRTDVLVNVSNFDARLRPWYTGAAISGALYWSEPYVLSTGQDLAIACSLPVYDEQGDLLGVVSVDIFISQVTDFLQALPIGKTGQAYIVDETGLLVATSTGAAPFVKGEDTTWQRLGAAASADPITAASAAYIRDDLGGFAGVADQEQYTLQIDGKLHYLQVKHYQNPAGLHWLIVMTIPEDNFMGQIQAQNRVTLGLTAIAIILAVLVGFVTAMQVSRPIARLSAAAADLAQGNWSRTVPITGVLEIQQMGQSFNGMAAELHKAFNHLEERVQERTAALATSEARYRAIVEDQTELICRFLPDNTLTFVNDAYCRYFGLSRAVVIGNSFLPRIHHPDQTQLAEQLATLTTLNPTVTSEHRTIKGDGEIRWMQWVNHAFFDEQGQLKEIQAVGRDITEHKQFEATLQKALMRETELNELKSQFISTVSHEFRTPMAIIMSSSDIIQHYGDRIDREKQIEHFQRIRLQLDRMTNLLDDVLTINRAQRGKWEFYPEPLDVVSLCQSIINEIRSTDPNAIVFNFASDGDCSEVTADKKLLRLIIMNLVSNAAKYSPKEAAVNITLQCSPTQIFFTVQDYGIGIPKEVQARIFDPFYRATNVSTIPGTGLGLSIVKQSVEQHGGTITFESEIGQGTTFSVVLPHP